MPRTRLLLIPLCILLGAANAQAQEEPVVAPVAVMRPRFSLSGRFELSASATFQVFGRLTDHGGFDGAFAYNIVDSVAVEVRGGYLFSRQTRLARDVAQSVHLRDPNVVLRVTDDFAHLWELRAHGVVGVRYAPLYGKLSLFSEIPAHYQVYLWAGAGVGMFQRQSLVICNAIASRDEGTCSDPLRETSTRFLASFAVGWRFFIGRQHGLKLELRNYLFTDPHRVEVDRVETEAGRPSGRFQQPPGMTPLFFLEAGYVFVF